MELSPRVELEPVYTFIPKGMGKYIRYVAIYLVKADEGGYLVNFIPRGSLELIFQCGNTAYHKPFVPSASWIERPDVFVGGLQSGAFQARLSSGYFVSVDFQPGMSRHFVPGDQAEFGNRVTDAEDVFTLEFRDLADELGSNRPCARTIDTISRTLYASFRPLDASCLELVLREIEQQDGKVEISRLEQLAGLKTSRFREKFRREVGISPKRYLSIVRTQAVLTELGKPLSSSGKLTDLAYRHKYHDQAHFIREFKGITGFTPGEMRKLYASGVL